MRTPISFRWRASLLGALSALLIVGGAERSHAIPKFDESNERIKLYTKPDPSSAGGIEGKIVGVTKPIRQILAIPPDAPEKVYRGTVGGPEQRSFNFTGLPIRKYDLIVIFDDAMYEGLQLHRGESTLVPGDKDKVKAIIDKSEPFFTKKVIHRLEGETGRGNFSRCICTFIREKSSITYIDPKNAAKSGSGAFRRTFKLVMLKDVGPGWQIVRARDLYPIWADPKQGLPRHYFHKSLSRIRVADAVKDLGDIDLKGAE